MDQSVKMNDLPYTNLEKGTLLVSNPDLADPNFSRVVILICEHSSAGSFGLIINKPLKLDKSPEIIPTQVLNNPKIKLCFGGIAQQSQMMLLHSSDKNADQTLKVTDHIFLGGDMDFLQDNLSSEACPEMLLCFGYVGWMTGELEREFMAGSWFLYPGDKSLVFDTPREKIWQQVLKKMGGKFASYAMIPEDLSLN